MLLKIKVVPRAAQNEIRRLADGSYQARLTAPPVDGRANEALIKLLSKEFAVAKGQISIVRGTRGRNKTVEIEGLSGH